MLRLHPLDYRICFNDQIEDKHMRWADKVLISPGPGLPEESGQLMDIIRVHHKNTPMLGICLGHQAIAQVFGSPLHQMEKPKHGKTVNVKVVYEDPIVKDLPPAFQVGLYHSWTLQTDTLAPSLKMIARYRDHPMIIRHREYPLYGIQFHPESYATQPGNQLIGNWLYLN